ncbi:MAG: hypothetical protein MR616_06555, partial [Pyramidobacter sp.]|nr:hypothetical protein [Pyramidobacter sp.]
KKRNLQRIHAVGDSFFCTMIFFRGGSRQETGAALDEILTNGATVSPAYSLALPLDGKHDAGRFLIYQR